MTDPVVSAVKTEATAEVMKQVSFFERNPKATAIGSFALGVIVTAATFHFL